MTGDARRAPAALLLVVATAVSAAPPHYDRWETFDTGNGLPSDKAMCVLATGDDVWVGTDRGLARYRAGSWTTFTRRDGLAHDAVLALAVDADTGDLWIATMGGLTRYSAGRLDTFTQFNSGLPNDVVYGVAAHRGEIWAATAAGAGRYRIAADQWTIYDETNAPMHEIWCYSVTASGHRVYLAVWGGGLLEYQIDRDHWKHYRDPDGEMEIDLFRDDGLVHDVVAGVTVDDRQRVWIATYFGLSSYDGRRWRNFMDHDSPLVSNFVNFVTARGEFCWIGTDDGLNASDRDNWWTYRRDVQTGGGVATWHPSGGPTEQMRTETSFPHNYILGISFQGDDIWLATEAGAARGTKPSPRPRRNGAMRHEDPDNGDVTVARKTRIVKRPIENHAVLNEAYDYRKKVSFSRGMRVELRDCVMLFISGTASVDENGDSIHPGDVKDQARRMFNNIKGLLESEGADWHDVVRTTCYLADFRQYEQFNEVRNAFYEAEGLDPLPASTCIEARICRPDLLVETEAIAIVPRKRDR